mmetsp:Transcript_22824/g.63549  ORF Transcript_22824/g.63549 Transcript_22824/m.63549 type:complete len:223 (+) Transcript_22824:712-1380(+)
MSMPIFARGTSTYSAPSCLVLVLSRSSTMSSRALLTASAVPHTLTWQGSPVWSRASTLKAPLFLRISMMVCACLPMILPSSAFGTGTNSSTAGSRKTGMSSGGGSSGVGLGPRRSSHSTHSRTGRGAAGGGGGGGGGAGIQPLPPPSAWRCGRGRCGPGCGQGQNGPPTRGPGICGHIGPCQPRSQTSCRQSDRAEAELPEEDEDGERARRPARCVRRSASA